MVGHALACEPAGGRPCLRRWLFDSVTHHHDPVPAWRPPPSAPPFSPGELQILLPVVGRDVVLTGADVVAHVFAHRLVEPRHLHRADPFPAEELPNHHDPVPAWRPPPSAPPFSPGELQILLPVVGRDVVLTGADVVAHVSTTSR